MYLTRSLEKIVAAASDLLPVVLVTGARQVGKTTLLRHLAACAGIRDYVSLDDPLRRDPACMQPEALPLTEQCAVIPACRV